MEDSDGTVIPNQNDFMEDENSLLEDSEDSSLTKSSSLREFTKLNIDKSPTDSNSVRNFVGFSNVNGDCNEKIVSNPERILASSPTNSISSVYSETTRDSLPDDSSPNKDIESDSDNDTKSSCSNSSEKKENFTFQKNEEDSHQMSSELSNSSSDTDLSDSDESVIGRDDRTFSDAKTLDNVRISPNHSNDSEIIDERFSSEADSTFQNIHNTLKNTTKIPSPNGNQRNDGSEIINDDSAIQNVSSLLPLDDTTCFENPTTCDSNQDLTDSSCKVKQNNFCEDFTNDNNLSTTTSDIDIQSSESQILEKQSTNDSNITETALIKDINVVNESNNSFADNDAEMPPDVDNCLSEQSVSDQHLKGIEDQKLVSIPQHNLDEEINVNKINDSFSIRYTGFKTSRTVTDGTNFDDLKNMKYNPFNPALKGRSKIGFGCSNVGDEAKCSSLQPEYAQYLGLQPIVKFKCSNCGISSFKTMSALNTHQVECKKNGKQISQNSEISAPPDSNSANIKLSRKVFLCSSCGTYYENCDLFLHMREYHRRYICLFCLHMAQSPETLQQHLILKHNTSHQSYSSIEELQKHSPQTFFLLCLHCDKVFTEMDDSVNHKCNIRNNSDGENITLSNRPRTDAQYQSSANDVISISANNNPNLQMLQNSVENNSCLSINFSHLDNETKCTSGKDLQGSQNVDYAEKSLETNIDVINTKIDKQDIAEHLLLKVPCDIDIKPFVPGGNIDYLQNEPNKSSVEIFPISKPLSTIKKKVKFIKKTKKTIKKAIKKKLLTPLKIKAVIDNLQNTSAINPTIDNFEAQPSAIVEPQLETRIETETSKIEETPSALEQPSISPHISLETAEVKKSISQEVFKMKLPGEIVSDGESDDSQKLSMDVDENTNNSDSELIKSECSENGDNTNKKVIVPNENNLNEADEITFAREDVPAMALTLDNKIENVPIQAVVKECVRTSCLSCNYCRHACKIAVNGKQLAIHLLSEHRYTPVKNETHDDVVRKLMSSLEELQNMHFNAETYDSADPSIHIPYDQEKNYDCFQCSYVSSSHKDLYAHKKKSHTKSLLLCIMCKSTFYSYSELICHICPGSYYAKVQFHNTDLTFHCCFCRLDTIPSAFRLMVHLRKSHHTCDICLEMCTDQQKLSTHMWKHKLNHLCYRCGIAYASKPDITKHLFWKHGTESVLCKKCLQKKWPHVYHFCIPPNSFICEECNTSFSKAVALKVHKRLHGNDYPYSCEQCEKKFISKKLLSRHIERHIAIAQRKEKLLLNPEEQEDKDEIISVTDINDGKYGPLNECSDINKETDSKDRGHKKHKKDKDKKEKKIVDVFDLPPLNLSSDSDSSDEGNSSKALLIKEVKGSNTIDLNLSSTKLISETDEKFKTGSNNADNIDVLPDKNKSTINCETLVNNEEENHGIDIKVASSKPLLPGDKSPYEDNNVNALLNLNKEHVSVNEPEENNQVDGIWENFYKTNPQNSNLPFPLSAMKSEEAYNIIMGDHDYCQPAKLDPIIKEDLPTVSNFDAGFSDDKLEEMTSVTPEKTNRTPPRKEQETPSTPTSIAKKRLKSPKKKTMKTPDDNNSSTSSDSSSDSDTSSCSCGTNCSCSSSSSNSSSSSSSDSDSSTNEDKSKLDKRKKRKDKRLKQKSESEIEANKEITQKEPETILPSEPEDPPIRESELETDETTSDEEFYDRQPQIIANQMLAEKRQMVLLASGAAPVNNGNASPTVIPTQESVVVPPPPEQIETPRSKSKPRRKRKLSVTPKLTKMEKLQPPHDNYSKFLIEPKPYSPFQPTILTPKPKLSFTISPSPSLSEAGGSGPETDLTRLSKRRRVRNKFYGYSSGEEDESSTPRQLPKWRKTDSHVTTSPVTPKTQPSLPPPTPRIQLTVPKQIIRKPTYHKANLKQTKLQQSSSGSSESGSSDVEERIPTRPILQPEPIKAEKDVYCYCRCPYDEVSEMIACDDSNCKIEWFHFECVGILVPPRGQWFCPGCRKARGLPT